MKEYLVSIITPFHNTKIDFFRRGYESLKNQTLGFENIEWVVVIHNSDSSYAEEARKIVKDSGNVKLFVLNNDKRTPSSPRNHALTKATGKYIGFMDSDDYLTPDGLKDVVEHMESSGAEIASFRAETEPEDETVIQAIDTRARFDQTVSSVVLSKDDPELNDLIYAGGLTIWSKLIRRDFLVRYGITFSEDMTYGEDVCFSMECLGKAKKVVLLPQTIVYVYFMNHGSLAQETNHTPESLRKLAEDFARIFDITIKGGFALEKLGWPVLGYLAEMLAATPGLSEEFRKGIRDLMGGYFDCLGTLEPDEKFFNSELASYFMQRARTVILGEKEEDALTNNVLIPILRSNARTEYGVKYGFDHIRTLKEYQEAVPLSDYRTYRPLVKLMTRIGESNLISSEKIVAYSKKICPDGDELLIPQTATFIKTYQDRLLQEINSAESSCILLMNGLKNDGSVRFNDGALLSSIRTTVLDRIRKADIYNSHLRSARNKYGTVTDPEDLIFDAGEEDVRYAKCLFALADGDVSKIIAPFSSDVLNMMRYMECMWEDLVSDLASGTISERSGISEGLRERLSSELKASVERAEKLREEFEKGFSGIARRIWPSLTTVWATGSGENSVYSRALLKYLGDVPLDYGYLDCAEAIIGRSAGPGQNQYLLLENTAFFEFLPENAEEEILLSSGELIPGERYEVVITNQAGLYRYRSGMIIESSRIEEGQVYIRYCYNTRNVLKFAGVRMDTLLLRQAGKKIDEETGFLTYDYCLIPDEEAGRFVLFMKPEKSGQFDLKQIQEIVENNFEKMNPSYASGIREGRIRPVEVLLLPASDRELVKGKAPVFANLIHASGDRDLLLRLKKECREA